MAKPKGQENKVEILSLERRIGKVTLRSAFSVSTCEVQSTEGLVEKSLADALQQMKSLFVADDAELAAAEPPFTEINSVDDIVPNENEFIYPTYRALSAVVTPGYFLDFTRPGVLEEAVTLLNGQTVYKNHCYWDVERWLGIVKQAVWDAKGEKTDGIPGINAQLMIDAKMNPKIARGILIRAIHSCSLTLLFEFEYSHPKLVEDGLWWRLLGQEVDGQIVRFIVTKIREIWELSLVHNGEDRQAKKLPDDSSYQMSAEETPREQPKEEKRTVKLTKEQKAAFGITHEGDDVPDEVVTAAMQKLASQAAAGQQLLESARTECRRVATLAIVGSKEGTLPEAISSLIDKADAKEVEGLTKMYTEQAAKNFPENGRSSLENKEEIHEAGGVNKDAKAQKRVKPVPIY